MYLNSPPKANRRFPQATAAGEIVCDRQHREIGMPRAGQLVIVMTTFFLPPTFQARDPPPSRGSPGDRMTGG
jgi:hypothetical protein